MICNQTQSLSLCEEEEEKGSSFDFLRRGSAYGVRAMYYIFSTRAPGSPSSLFPFSKLILIFPGYMVALLTGDDSDPEEEKVNNSNNNNKKKKPIPIRNMKYVWNGKNGCTYNGKHTRDNSAN
eukprot:gene12753-8693_t